MSSENIKSGGIALRQKRRRDRVEFLGAFPLDPMARSAEKVKIATAHALQQREAAAGSVHAIFDAPENERGRFQFAETAIAGEIDRAKIGNSLRAEQGRAGDNLRLDARLVSFFDKFVGNSASIVHKVTLDEGRQL